MALGSISDFSRYDPIQRLLRNPKTNPELALLQRAFEASATYTGRVPGGRPSPFLANSLRLALEDDGIKDPITGKLKVIPGYIGNLADNIFSALSSDKSRLEVTLRGIALQRKRLREQEEARQEQKAYLRNIFNRDSLADDKTRIDAKKRAQDFINSLGLNREKKAGASLTDISSLAKGIPGEKLAFDSDGDLISDYDGITANPDISTELKSYVTVTKGASYNIVGLLQDNPPATIPTHVLVKLSGARETYVDKSDPDINIERIRLGFTRGRLELNGAELDPNQNHILTWQDFVNLNYKAGSDKALDAISIIPFNDADADGQLTNQDSRGNFQSVLFEASGQISSTEVEGVRFLGATLPLPKESEASGFNLAIQGNSVLADFLADLNSGKLEIYAYEHGYPLHKVTTAKVDLSKSSGNILRFEFDQPAKDKIDLRLVLNDSGISINNLAVVP